MQVLLVRQVLERKAITLAFIQTKSCSPFVLAEPQHSQHRRAEDRNTVAEPISTSLKDTEKERTI